MKKFFSLLAAMMFMASSAFATKIYCKVTADWWNYDYDNHTAVGAYAFGDGGALAEWPGVVMTQVSGEDHMWEIDLDVAKYPNIIFLRVLPNGEYKGVKTSDLVIPTDGANLYTITKQTYEWGVDGEALLPTDGEWSLYEPQGDVPGQPKFYVTGNADIVGAGNEWKKETALVAYSDTLSIQLAAGEHELKVITVDDQWLGSEALTAIPEGVTTSRYTNVRFFLAKDDEVKVIFVANPRVFTLEGNFDVNALPSGNIRLVPGVWNLAQAQIAAVTWKVGETMMQGTVSAWFDYQSVSTMVGSIPVDADSIAFARFNSEVAAPSLDMSTIWNHSDKLLIDASMIYTISGWEESGKDYCPGYWGEPVEPTILDNGYYLIGSEQDWQVANLTKDLMFSLNPDAAEQGEYMLATTLVVEQAFKVVYVENNGEKQIWYPEDYDGAYQVDAAHAGEKTVYFRPGYNGGEDWHYGCIFVPANEQGIEEVIAAGKAAKVVRNGQMMILKADKTFDVTGARIR